MGTQFPVATIAWTLFTALTVAGGVSILIGRALAGLSLSRGTRLRWQIIIPCFLAVWFMVRLAWGIMSPRSGPWLIALSFIVIFSAAGLALLASNGFRKAVFSVPPGAWVGIQSVRVGGFAFLALFDMGLLPAAFALPAGIGDIAIGLTAPLIAWALFQGKPRARTWALLWNWLGLVDFAIALVTGIVFIQPHVRQLMGSGQSIDYLAYVLMIPGFAVPILTLVHWVALHNLRHGLD